MRVLTYKARQRYFWHQDCKYQRPGFVQLVRVEPHQTLMHCLSCQSYGLHVHADGVVRDNLIVTRPVDVVIVPDTEES